MCSGQPVPEGRRGPLQVCVRGPLGVRQARRPLAHARPPQQRPAPERRCSGAGSARGWRTRDPGKDSSHECTRDGDSTQSGLTAAHSPPLAQRQAHRRWQPTPRRRARPGAWKRTSAGHGRQRRRGPPHTTRLSQCMRDKPGNRALHNCLPRPPPPLPSRRLTEYKGLGGSPGACAWEPSPRGWRVVVVVVARPAGEACTR